MVLCDVPDNTLRNTHLDRVVPFVLLWASWEGLSGTARGTIIIAFYRRSLVVRCVRRVAGIMQNYTG